jgi:hypothetical protein
VKLRIVDHFASGANFGRRQRKKKIMKNFSQFFGILTAKNRNLGAQFTSDSRQTWESIAIVLVVFCVALPHSLSESPTV